MESPPTKNDFDLFKIRRFALAIALILIIYSISGVKIDTPAKIQPLGIPLIIERPDLIGLGFVIASVYSIFRFVYYGMLIFPGKYNPIRAKKRLLHGELVDPTARPHDVQEFYAQVTNDILRYYPHTWKGYPYLECSSSGGTYSFKMPKLPWLIRWSAKLEDLDFLLPLIANLGALVIYCCHSI
ncbi:MAG: hypothetical protein ABSF48_29305 [Thermodesulfobacteriota bacterium]